MMHDYHVIISVVLNLDSFFSYACNRVTTCGSTISNNCTHITNPSYPSSTSSGTCAYNVSPLSSDICQIRLDFTAFDLTETTVGVCTDKFDITSGSSRDYYSLCGTLTGQHSE